MSKSELKILRFEFRKLENFFKIQFQLKYIEEAFTSEHWLVRIYKVKKESNSGLRLKRRPVSRPKISGKTKFTRYA